jgi:hypothetical protein
MCVDYVEVTVAHELAAFQNAAHYECCHGRNICGGLLAPEKSSAANYFYITNDFVPAQFERP